MVMFLNRLTNRVRLHKILTTDCHTGISQCIVICNGKTFVVLNIEHQMVLQLTNSVLLLRDLVLKLEHVA